MIKFDKKSLLLVILLAILAVFLRFYRLPATFSIMFDQARDIEASLKIVDYHQFTLLGPQTSFGQWSNQETFFGPIHFYLIVLSMLVFGRSLLSPIYLTGITNLLSCLFVCLLIYKITKNRLITLLITALYTFSSISVAYSRFLWNPNWLPFFVSLMLYFFWLSLEKKSTFWLILAGLCSGLALQSHYVVIPVVITPVILLFLSHKGWTAKIHKILIYAIGGTLGFSPIIMFEIRHHFYITNAFIFQVSHSSGLLNSGYFGLIGAYFISLWLRMFGFITNISIAPTYLATLLTLFILLTVLFLACKTKKVDQTSAYVFRFLLPVIIIGIFFAPFWSASIHRAEDRYYLPIFIPAVLFYANLLKVFINKFNNKAAYSLLIAINLVFIALNLRWDIKLITHNPQINTTEVSYQGAITVADLISDDVNKDGSGSVYNIANIVDGNTRGTYYRFLLNENGTPPLSVEQYPNAGVLYVLSTSADENYVQNYPVWEISAFCPCVTKTVIKAPYDTWIHKLVKKPSKV